MGSKATVQRRRIVDSLLIRKRPYAEQQESLHGLQTSALRSIEVTGEATDGLDQIFVDVGHIRTAFACNGEYCPQEQAVASIVGEELVAIRQDWEVRMVRRIVSGPRDLASITPQTVGTAYISMSETVVAGDSRISSSTSPPALLLLPEEPSVGWSCGDAPEDGDFSRSCRKDCTSFSNDCVYLLKSVIRYRPSRTSIAREHTLGSLDVERLDQQCISGPLVCISNSPEGRLSRNRI